MIGFGRVIQNTPGAAQVLKLDPMPPKHHHTLPQFWLKGFTDPDTPASQEPYLFCWRPDTGTWKKRAPINVLAQPDYYSYENTDGQLSTDLETGLAGLEGVAALAIRALASRTMLDDLAEVRLAHFVALLMLRVPFWQDFTSKRLDRFGKSQIRRTSRDLKADPQNFAESKRRWREHRGVDDSVDFSIGDLEQCMPTVSINKAGRLGAAFAPLEQTAEDLYMMDWRFVLSEPPDFFITSDNPVALANPNTAEDRVPGIRQPGTELTVPLTRTLALVAKKGDVGRWFQEVGAATVARINLATADLSTGHLFAPKMLFPGFEMIRDGGFRQIPIGLHRMDM